MEFLVLTAAWFALGVITITVVVLLIELFWWKH